MEKITYIEAIKSLVPGAKFGIYDNDLTRIDWQDESKSQPSDADIEAELVRLQEEYDAQEYASNRAAEYPSIAELTVALYDTDDKTALETKRTAVKKKWPKDNSGPVE